MNRPAARHVAPRHISWLTPYVPVASLVFLFFLGFAAGDHDRLPVVEDAYPTTSVVSLGEHLIAQGKVAVGFASSTTRTDAPAPQKALSDRSRYGTMTDAARITATSAPPAVPTRTAADSLAFLRSRPTRAGP